MGEVRGLDIAAKKVLQESVPVGHYDVVEELAGRSPSSSFLNDHEIQMTCKLTDFLRILSSYFANSFNISVSRR